MSVPDPSGSRAVLIGTHADCQGLGDWADDLPSVAENLTELHKILTDGSVWRLAPEHCVYLPQPMDPRVVLRAVEKAAAEATDTLLVYLAGHGLLDDNNRLYVALPGANAEYECLSYDHLNTCIRRHRSAPRTIVIVDCCYSGQAIQGGMGDSPRSYELVVKRNTLITGACVLTASAATRKAIAPPGERFTAFTGELIALLSEGIPGGSEYLDMATIYSELRDRLARRPGIPEPQFGTNNYGGHIVFMRNSAYRAANVEKDESHSLTKKLVRERGGKLTSKSLSMRLEGIEDLDRMAADHPKFRPEIARMLAELIRQQTQEIPEDSESLQEDVMRSLDAIRVIGFDKLNLSGARLIGVDLRGKQLLGVDLSGADLRRANLENADLRRSSLVGANLTGANLNHADLDDADLREADLTGASTEDVQIWTVSLDGATLNDDLHEKIHEIMHYNWLRRIRGQGQYPYD
ncbi:caspase, EACC1-associated type [Streptomyces mirabilis]|uniref:caspase, EACC1-associated type n=1 Tax=Streptomyces mirabilis TaxID=68239 RepID=UPI0036866BA7